MAENALSLTDVTLNYKLSSHGMTSSRQSTYEQENYE